MRNLTAALMLSFVLTGAVRADVLHVPADFDTIQDAVSAAAEDDEILVAAGTYAESVVIAGKAKLSLRGQGKVILTGGQALMPSLLIDSSSGIRIEKLRLQELLGGGISIADSSDVTVTRCRIDDPHGPGILVANSSSVLLDRDVVEHPNDIGLHSTASDFVTVQRCTVRASDNDSVSFQEGDHLVLDRVRVEDSNENGIALTDVTAASVRDCLVRNPGQTGISVTGADVQIDDNRVLDVPEGSVGLSATVQGGVIRGNRVVGGNFAMNVGGSEVQVLDNRVAKGGLLGIGAGTTGVVVLAGNRVLQTTGTAIQLAGPGVGVFTDNRVIGAAVGINVLANDVHLAGNRVSGASGNGFAINAIGCVLLANKAHGSGEFDLFDDSSDGNTYVDNDFGTTHFE